VSQRYVSIRIDCTGDRCVSEVCLNMNLWIDQPKEKTISKFKSQYAGFVIQPGS